MEEVGSSFVCLLVSQKALQTTINVRNCGENATLRLNIMMGNYEQSCHWQNDWHPSVWYEREIELTAMT